jgi:hypothetical protein
MGGSHKSTGRLSDPFEVVLDGGKRVALRLRVGAVLRQDSGAKYTVVFHRG